MKLNLGLDKITELANNTVASIGRGVDEVGGLISKTGIVPKKEEGAIVPDEKGQEETASKMLAVMDWAFDKANGEIPGFGTSADMAKKYLEKYGNVSSAIDHLVNWQIVSAATAGFVTSLGGLPTMALTLPANVAGVMAIQLRMIGAIACLGNQDLKTEEAKTGMYLCLLGSKASETLSNTAGQFAIKFATASLRKLPGEVLVKINKAVGFRLFTKFGEKGLVNIHKAIPILGGVVGGTVDALSTYAIANAAKALFLGELIDGEKQERNQVEIIKICINMSLADGELSNQEKEVLMSMVAKNELKAETQEKLMLMIESNKVQNIDYSILKGDKLVISAILSQLAIMVKSDGNVSIGEKFYCKEVLEKLGVDCLSVEDIIN